MSGEYTGSLEELTPLQKRNLLAFRIRKLLTKQSYGDKVVIVTPESEVIEETHPMALPLSDINTNKQVVMTFDGIKEYPDGTKEYEFEHDDQPMSDTAEDIVVALKRTLNELEGALKPGQNRRKQIKKQVRCEEQSEVPVTEAAQASSIGTVIARSEDKDQSKVPDKDATLQELIKRLLN